jgi:hypothetical protein
MTREKLREIGALIAASAVAWFAFRIVPSPEPTSSEWAAWVQAVGSIGAIAGAAWIARRQGVEALERDERQRAADVARLADDRLALLTVVSMLVSDACARARELIEQLEAEDPPLVPYSVATINSFTQGCSAMRQLPLHELRPVEAVRAFASAIDIAQLSVTYLEAAAERYGHTEDEGARRRQRLASVSVLEDHLLVLDPADAALRGMLEKG